MEQKLKEFRNKQRRERLWNMISFTKNVSRPSTPVECASPVPASTPTSEIVSDDESITSEVWNSSEPFYFKLHGTTKLLYFLLWLTCLLIAIQLEFATIYFILSALILIYLNTRTRAKNPGEVSAYSVFNPNCESIDGTLKAEQFEREFNLIHYSPPK